MSRKKIIVISILLLLFLGIFLLTLYGPNNFLDQGIYQGLMSLRCKGFDHYFTFITRFANTATILVIVAAFILIFRNRYGIFLGASACTSVILNSIMKHLVQRPRPDHLRLISERGYSFPSGHAMISICVYGYLLYLVSKKISNRYLRYGLMSLLGLLILSIGLSRIYVGVHYPTDVIAGYLLATVAVLIFIDVSQKIYHRGD